MLYQSVIPGPGTCMSELWLWCKQYLTVPRKRTGSWGMTDSLLLKASRPTWVMLTPSMMMDPPLSSTSLKSATPSEDLPEETGGQSLYLFTSVLIKLYSTNFWCSTEISNKYIASTEWCNSRLTNDICLIQFSISNDLAGQTFKKHTHLSRSGRRCPLSPLGERWSWGSSEPGVTRADSASPHPGSWCYPSVANRTQGQRRLCSAEVPPSPGSKHAKVTDLL